MNEPIRVRKFGGTSVGTVQGLKNTIDILEQSEEEIQWVVVSACAGITDQLEQLAHRAASGSEKEWQSMLDSIEQHHQALLHHVLSAEEFATVWQSLQPWFHQLHRLAQGVAYLRELTERQLAAFVAFGELLSSTFIAAILECRGADVQWVDARTLLRTRPDRWIEASLQWELSQQQVRQFWMHHRDPSARIFVTQGYIARNEQGHTTVFGRGGSDYSAAVFGALLQTPVIEIWTDVPGILTADPQVVSEAQPLPQLSFATMRRMALFGAKVLHPDTLGPAEQARIPVYIRSTLDPAAPGTEIRAQTQWNAPALFALALRSAQPLHYGTAGTPENATGWLLQQYPDVTVMVGGQGMAARSCDVVTCFGSSLTANVLQQIFERLGDLPVSFVQMSAEFDVCVLGVPASLGETAVQYLHPLCLQSLEQQLWQE